MCLAQHPMLMEKIPQRIKYLHALDYIIEKHGKNDRIMKAVFEIYKTAFLGYAGFYEKLSPDDALKNLKKILKAHLRRFKFFSYRYVFIIDIAIILSPFEKEIVPAVSSEIKKYINRNTANKIDELVHVLFENQKPRIKFNLISYHLDCWREIRQFFTLPEKRIMISSNMSSGKSTLINTIVGKRINRSMNEACTSKLHFINDKAFEDKFIYKNDYKLNMNADIETLMKNNPENKSGYISVVSYFRYAGIKNTRLCLIDSPGVNNALDKTQEEIKNTIVSQKFNAFVYVINGEYIGTTDDFVYLQYLRQNLAGKKIVFVINKLDRFRIPEDCIEESITKMREQLASLGFENPIVCPVSAYAGLLAKRMIYDKDLDEGASDEYTLMENKFNRPEYDLSKYYDSKTRSAAEDIIKNINDDHKNEMTLLHKSGMLCLETLLYDEGVSK
jgi:GTPase Era involved in 16S rRNA processing